VVVYAFVRGVKQRLGLSFLGSDDPDNLEKLKPALLSGLSELSDFFYHRNQATRQIKKTLTLNPGQEHGMPLRHEPTMPPP